MIECMYFGAVWTVFTCITIWTSLENECSFTNDNYTSNEILGQCEFNKGKVKLQKISFKNIIFRKRFRGQIFIKIRECIWVLWLWMCCWVNNAMKYWVGMKATTASIETLPWGWWSLVEKKQGWNMVNLFAYELLTGHKEYYNFFPLCVLCFKDWYLIELCQRFLLCIAKKK